MTWKHLAPYSELFFLRKWYHSSLKTCNREETADKDSDCIFYTVIFRGKVFMHLLIIYIFTVTLIFCTSLYLGIYSLMLSPKNKVHRYFFLAILSLSLAYLVMIVIQFFRNIDHIWLIYKTGIIFIFFFFYFILLFLIHLSMAFSLIIVSRVILILCLIAGIVTAFSRQYIIFGFAGSLVIVTDTLPTFIIFNLWEFFDSLN